MGNNISVTVFRDLHGHLFRYIKRRTRRFNVIPRAEKQIDKIKESPTRAPTYEATMKQVEELMKELPEKSEELKEKDDTLHKNLENVYVTSEGKNTDTFSHKRIGGGSFKRIHRTQSEHEDVPEGKFNLVRAEHFMAAHERDPNVYNADVLGEVYKVDKNVMKNVLKFVKIYSVGVPVKVTEMGHVPRMARELAPPGFHEEPAADVLERKICLAKDQMARYYKKNSPASVVYSDLSMFETLVALKPFTIHMKEQLFSKKELFSKKPTQNDLRSELQTEYINPYERKHEEVITPEMAEEDFFRQQTKKKLDQHSLLESGETPNRENLVDTELSEESSRQTQEPSENVETKISDKA